MVTISRGSCRVRYPTPDGDGWVNLAEYALGIAPKTASTNGLWTAVDRNATNVARFYRAAY